MKLAKVSRYHWPDLAGTGPSSPAPLPTSGGAAAPPPATSGKEAPQPNTQTDRQTAIQQHVTTRGPLVPAPVCMIVLRCCCCWCHGGCGVGASASTPSGAAIPRPYASRRNWDHVRGSTRRSSLSTLLPSGAERVVGGDGVLFVDGCCLLGGEGDREGAGGGEARGRGGAEQALQGHLRQGTHPHPTPTSSSSSQ